MPFIDVTTGSGQHSVTRQPGLRARLRMDSATMESSSLKPWKVRMAICMLRILPSPGAKSRGAPPANSPNCAAFPLPGSALFPLGPGVVQTPRRHGHAGLERLRKQGHAELLDQPAELVFARRLVTPLGLHA